MLAPRVVKKEPQIEDFIVRANDNLDAEGGPDLNLNPVVQARFLIEQENKKLMDRNRKRGPGAYGALRKLNLNITGKKKDAQQAGLNVVDVALQKEAQELKRAEAQALALVEKQGANAVGGQRKAIAQSKRHP